MRKRIRFKSLLRDSFVVIFCLSVAGFFAYLFWQDLNSFTVRGDKPEIGTISFKHNIAQRKFDDRVVWERIATGTKLYYGDTIRTSDLAEAILTLSDGTVLNLGENTMIKVDLNANGGVRVLISGGDIQVDSTTARAGIELKLDDGSLVNVGAGSSLAAKSDSENGIHNVEVKSGSAQVVTESGKTTELTYGESVNVEKGGEIQKKAVTVIYPPKDVKILSTRKGLVPVRFEWKTSDGAGVTIQTSYSRDFTKIVTSNEISNSSSAEVRVPGGIVFWRVFSEKTKASPITGRITVENVDAIEGISPASSASFRYRNAPPRISFRWSGNEYAEHYRLLVSSTADMRSIVSDTEVSGNFIALDSLEDGDYWWQVTPYYSINNLGYTGGSQAIPFKITKTQQIRRPELAAPANNTQIFYKKNIPANFIWKSELKDSTYELSIARDYDFTDTVYSAETSDTRLVREFTPEELSDGTYYWKILRKSDDAGDKNPESEIRSFRVARYIPQDNKLLYPPENVLIEGAKITSTAFMWKLSDEYSSKSNASVLQISTTPGFTTIQIERTTSASVLDNMNLPSGNYWWRVGVRDENGGLTGLTPSRAFTVLSELKPPEILSPAQNQELMIYNFAPVVVSWKEVPDAEYYTVKICDSKGNLIKQKESVRETMAQFVLDGGTYTCFVQAIATPTRISAVNERTFSVRSPSSVLAQSPSDGTRIAGLTALRNPVIFSWIPGKDKANGYKFILSKLQKDGSYKVVNTIDTTKNTLSLNRLTEGTYSWKIAASTMTGIPLDSKTRHFVIETTPGLASPVLTAPGRNFVIDGAYLKKNRAIEFAWKEVTGATAYNFVLYKLDSAGRRKLIYSEKNTKASNVRIKDLSIFDVGNFEWAVTPYSYAKDGYLEQKGTASVGVFKIDFAAPTKVEGVQPGKMYGN